MILPNLTDVSDERQDSTPTQASCSEISVRTPTETDGPADESAKLGQCVGASRSVFSKFKRLCPSLLSSECPVSVLFSFCVVVYNVWMDLW
jgi:hypothetical protein